EDERNKRERRRNWSKLDEADHRDHEEIGDDKRTSMKGQLQKDMDADNAEEREMLDDASSLSNNRKRKMGSPPLDRQPEMKKRGTSGLSEDGNVKGRVGYDYEE
ncbi:hypothetical protein HN51_065904, partial [Arachis hypogaea]